jgi:hypothetical protein
VRVGLAIAAVMVPVAAVGVACESSGGAARTSSADTGGRPAAGAPAPRIHRYVSPHGDDGNRGSRRRPWRTLGHAAARVRPGLTVHVAPGRYAGPLRITGSGTARRPVRFVPDRRWGAKISARDTGLVTVVEILGDHVAFTGFDVTGGGTAGAVGIDVEGSNNFIAGNRVHDLAASCAPGAGIAVGDEGYRAEGGLVAGNVVERIGTGPRDGTCRLMHGIYAAVPGVTIVNNIIQRAIGDGITSWHAARDLTIANNLSLRNGGAGILVGSGDAGATSIGHIRTLVSNNIVYRNALYGITETSDGAHEVGPANRYLHNLAFANRGGDRSSASGVGGLSSGEIVRRNLNADPLLTGPGYRPRAESPAVDAGTCDGASPRDFGGAARPQGRAMDIGPYERRSTPGRCDR